MDGTGQRGRISSGPLGTARSYLFVPGDQPDKLARAAQRGADALIIDLEDAVAPAAKNQARRAVTEWLRADRPGSGSECWVRINSGDLLGPDLRAIMAPALAGICVPKVASIDVLHTVDSLLAAGEAEAELPEGSVALAPLLETAAGVLQAQVIARAPRVHRLILGEADLGAELGVELSDDEREFLAVRTHLVLVSAAAGIAPPTAPALLDVNDFGRLRRSTEALRRMGFGSRLAVHPSQVPIINEVFTPPSAVVDAARRMIDRFEAAAAAGTGVYVDDDGRMVDEAVIRDARRIVGRAAGDPRRGDAG